MRLAAGVWDGPVVPDGNVRNVRHINTRRREIFNVMGCIYVYKVEYDAYMLYNNKQR